MDEYERHQKLWQFFQHFRFFIIRAFRLDCESIQAEGPILLVSNHVTACDPLLIGTALGKKQAYFVASDHVLRMGAAGRFIQWCFGPIPRRKGASALLTIKDCLRHFRAGHSICIFAEGEQSWDGGTIPVVEGTGSLAKAAGVTLVTYRLEGGYLSLPRWGRGLRRGRVRGRITGVYPPDVLASLSKEEINRLMNEGIRENAWERQKTENIRFRGRHPAERLEKCLYLCPACRGVGTLYSRGDRFACRCGFQVRYTDAGFFQPADPFPTIAEWDGWQKEQMRLYAFARAAGNGPLFSDPDVSLTKIDEKNRPERIAGKTEILQYTDRIVCGGRVFPLNEIRDMAMTQADRLLFSASDGYYEIRGGVSLRKYLEIWSSSLNGRL